jgi:Bacterial Ig-like domain
MASGRRRAGAGGSRLLPPLAVLALGCANIQPPPGGPPDTTPPTLAGVYPESMAVLPEFKGNVEFRFNEVVSEGSTPSEGRGTGDLEKLIILSPTTRFPNVGWHRSRITVKPAEGWKPNRVYRVELLPGITDVRQNRSKVEAVVTFSTGAELPHDTLSGRVFDWKAGMAAQGALIEALLEPDSLPYRTVTDSAGRFSFGPLPRGEFLVYGVLDQNHNLRFDPREAFDTVRVHPESAKAVVPELYAFAHDTLPPRIQQITPSDSVTATVTFAQSLDPYLKLDSSKATVRKLPDSTVVPVVALILRDTMQIGGERRPGVVPPLDTAALRRRLDSAGVRRARPDTGALRRPPPDTTRRGPTDSLAERLGLTGPPAAVMNRPPLSDRITLRVGQPWHPGDHFEVFITGVRTVSAVTGDVHAPLLIPVQTAPGRADSLRADSLKLRREHLDSISRPDSLRRKRQQ